MGETFDLELVTSFKYYIMCTYHDAVLVLVAAHLMIAPENTHTDEIIQETLKPTNTTR